MDLSKIKPAEGSVRKRKRVGRGEGSGHGGTSTRGHKGAKSRSGYSRKKGFEGGQMPLQRRVPKFGFRNRNRVAYRGVNLDTLQQLIEQNKLNEVNLETLIEKGLADKSDRVKILGRGELGSKVTIKAHAFSASAKSAIEKQGGEAIIL